MPRLLLSLAAERLLRRCFSILERLIGHLFFLACQGCIRSLESKTTKKQPRASKIRVSAFSRSNKNKAKAFSLYHQHEALASPEPLVFLLKNYHFRFFAPQLPAAKSQEPTLPRRLPGANVRTNGN